MTHYDSQRDLNRTGVLRINRIYVCAGDIMKWDDELERLSNAVDEAFGEQALNAAIQRAYGHAAMLVQTEPSPRRAPVPDAAAGNAADPASFEECLRAELRRVLKPH